MKGETICLRVQANHVCLSVIEELIQDESEIPIFSSVVRQRTYMWHKIRKKGKITGSTIYKGLGLESVKKQNKYIMGKFKRIALQNSQQRRKQPG